MKKKKKVAVAAPDSTSAEEAPDPYTIIKLENSVFEQWQRFGQSKKLENDSDIAKHLIER